MCVCVQPIILERERKFKQNKQKTRMMRLFVVCERANERTTCMCDGESHTYSGARVTRLCKAKHYYLAIFSIDLRRSRDITKARREFRK